MKERASRVKAVSVVRKRATGATRDRALRHQFLTCGYFTLTHRRGAFSAKIIVDFLSGKIRRSRSRTGIAALHFAIQARRREVLNCCWLMRPIGTGIYALKNMEQHFRGRLVASIQDPVLP